MSDVQTINVQKLTDDLDSRFSHNEQDFVVNRIANQIGSDVRDILIGDERLELIRRQYPISGIPISDIHHRSAAFAQMAMTVRSSECISLLLERAEKRMPSQMRQLVDAMPKGGQIYLVMNPETAESSGWYVPDGVSMAIDTTMFVKYSERFSSAGKFCIPNGVAFLVWRAKDESTDGLSMVIYRPEDMKLEITHDGTSLSLREITHDGTSNECMSLKLIDTFAPSVNGHCYQFKV